MARIFTTQFQYNAQSYEAIVTIIPKDDTTTFHVRVLDLDLQLLLPGGEVSYEGIEDFQTNTKADNNFSLALMSSISRAIDQHLASID